ncbi:MAG TPA: Yip1 family protein [Thermodesulfobacteriota bacterium]|nr:Yip1 family protein [Thermodesulfobacteriota bacterium]
MNLVQRVMDISLKPKDTWQVIKSEPATIKDLYTSYAVPLAAITPIASFIGFSLIGFSMLTMRYRIPLATGLSHAIVSYALSLVGIYVVAQIIDALAPNFGSQKNLINAMKVVVYSYTPAWVAGILLIIPGLSPITGLVSLYSLYILYLGLPVLMETPQDKAMGYFVVSIVVSILVFVVVGVVSRSLFGLGGLF